MSLNYIIFWLDVLVDYPLRVLVPPLIQHVVSILFSFVFYYCVDNFFLVKLMCVPPQTNIVNASQGGVGTQPFYQSSSFLSNYYNPIVLTCLLLCSIMIHNRVYTHNPNTLTRFGRSNVYVCRHTLHRTFHYIIINS